MNIFLVNWLLLKIFSFSWFSCFCKMWNYQITIFSLIFIRLCKINLAKLSLIQIKNSFWEPHTVLICINSELIVLFFISKYKFEVTYGCLSIASLSNPTFGYQTKVLSPKLTPKNYPKVDSKLSQKLSSKLWFKMYSTDVFFFHFKI